MRLPWVPQWLSKSDLNDISAVVATVEGSGEGNHLDLDVDVRLSEQRHSWSPVAGGDSE